MANPFVAEIRCFPFNFAPKGWAFCDGQILSISQNTALFSLLGTTYGGDGKSTFALPNLQGAVPLQQGQGPGLSLYDLGQSSGADFITLLDSEMPSHNHNVMSVPANSGQVNTAANNVPGHVVTNTNPTNVYITTPLNVTLSPNTISPAGGSQPHNNMMPYLTLNFCIALQGVFPPRT